MACHRAVPVRIGTARLSRHHRRRRCWEAAREEKRRKVRCHVCRDDSELGFFMDSCGQAVTSLPPERSRAVGKIAQAVRPVPNAPPAVRVAPADGPGGSPDGWEVPQGQDSRRESSKRKPKEAFSLDADDEHSYPHLQEYLRHRPKEEPGKSFAEARRYYGGASGTASATMTDDGHLTKIGARRICVICLGEEHKARACPGLRCFMCFETGHEAWQCPKASTKCSTCHRKGHSADGCVWQEVMDAARWHNYREVRCVNCGEYGHPACRTRLPLECKTASASSAKNSEEPTSRVPKDNDIPHARSQEQKWYPKNNGRGSGSPSRGSWGGRGGRGAFQGRGIFQGRGGRGVFQGRGGHHASAMSTNAHMEVAKYSSGDSMGKVSSDHTSRSHLQTKHAKQQGRSSGGAGHGVQFSRGAKALPSSHHDELPLTRSLRKHSGSTAAARSAARQFR